MTTSRYTPFPKMFAPSVSRRAGMQSQPAAVRPTDYRSLIPNHPVRARQRDPESIRGFTLLELLIVVGIIGLLMVLIAPAFTTIKSGTDVTSAAYTNQRRARHRAHVREGKPHLRFRWFRGGGFFCRSFR